ncbi:MAG: type II toxin-antitoxin system VapC family toxin, partial [Spartobacteria bacterium]
CLLDTCVFLWLALEPARLSKRAVDAINTAPKRFFSSAGLMEIAIKHSAGKLPLPENPRAWASSRMAFFQIALLPMDAEVVFLSGELPRLHSDPFDRLIAAESLHRNIPVITPDEPISALGARRIW